jgi:regulator of RNase E activity RraA
VGFVTNANGRDRSAIRHRTPDFHVFSTRWVVSHGYGVYIDFDVTVSICGLTIQPGDLLHDDESGLVSVPIDIAEDVVKQAGAVRQKEAEHFDFLESDAFTIEALKRRLSPGSALHVMLWNVVDRKPNEGYPL